MNRRTMIPFLSVALVTALAASALSAGVWDPPGPASRLLGNGRVLRPAGRLTGVGNFPTGGALTRDGRFYWALSTGRGKQDIRIVSVATGRVVQVLPVPGLSGGIAMDPTRPQAYVSGVQDSSHTDQQRLGLPGRAGDNVQVFTYDPATGRARFARLIATPPPPGSPVPQGIVDIPGYEGPPQEFPPTNTNRLAWPDRLAVSGDGSTLLVPMNLADHAAVINTTTGAVRTVAVGHYPYGAAVLRDGRTGLVSNESAGTVSVVDLASATKTADITVGPALSHPEAVLADPHADRAFVAVTNSDQVAVLDTASRTVLTTLSLDRVVGLGSAPVALSLARHGTRLLVAEEGADDIAVFSVPSTVGDTAGYRLLGRIPTADFPADVQSGGTTLVYLAAKSFGIGPNRSGPNPLSPANNDNTINRFSYLPSIVNGLVGVLPFPSDAQLRAYTHAADAQLGPADSRVAPVGTPLRPGGPIKHVFYVVKENRTYDQILGDLHRGDSDPKLSLFGPTVTPNFHALATRFPLLDHVYANSEASIDGHFWTSAGQVSDYVHKNWFQNYGGRGRPYDFGVYAVTWPSKGFLFDQAQRDNISYFNYGEAIAGVVPLPDKDRSAAATAQVVAKFTHSDLGAGTQVGVGATAAGQCYPNDADIETNAVTRQMTFDGTPPAGAPAQAESRFDCFSRRFDGQLASGTVPAFNYLVLPNDHTVGTSAGRRTPQAMVADNDYGLGQLVDKISHSSIWSSSAIFVVEDDSQDGADHVDAHRIPAAVISPYAARGAVVNDRYDFLSVIRSMELILGMHPIGFADALATPMYSAFTSRPANAEPYTALVPAQDRMALTAATGALARLSAGLDFRRLDQVDQRSLDAILWRSVYGADAAVPPPGPGATAEK
ncbi:MAG: bifunctional YncE family protein/alkaline phosphatase family protein [Actinomycetota bacterium]|nr:bifunctional YncE family protein/alkaline phosphatase family protein [Actinomycetota bacterium]